MSKTKTAKKTDKTVKAVKAAKKTEKTVKAVKAEKKTDPLSNIVNYNPLDKKNPQVLIDFGNDKHSKNAKNMLRIFSHLVVSRKVDSLHSLDFVNFVKLHTTQDFQILYPSFPDSPLHQGLHALAKTETEETRKSKDGKIVSDSFARGARALIYKDQYVGPKRKGSYHKNPKHSAIYQKYSDRAEAIIACKAIVTDCPRCK